MNNFFVKHRKNFTFILNVLFIIYTALLPFSYAFSVFTGPILLLLFWILEGNFNKKLEQILSEKALLFLFLFFAIHILSLFWTNDWNAASRVLKFYFAITVDIIVFYTSLQKRFELPVLITFLLSMFISEILLYGVFFEWWHFKKASPSNPSPIMHHVFYSIFVAVTAVLLLWQLFDKKNSIKLKIFELFFLTSTTINLFLNGGRTGQLGFLFAVFIFTITYFGLKKKYLLRTTGAMMILFLLAYQFSPVFHNKVHQGISDVHGILQGNLNSSWGLRVAMKKVGWEMVEDHPLLGVGVGDVLDEFRKYHASSDMKKYRFLATTTHVHDQWLQILLQTGIVGLIFFILFIYYLFKTNIEDPLIKAVFYAVLTIFVFSFFTDVPLRNFTAGLFGFIIGYLLHRAKNNENGNPLDKRAT